MDEQTCSRCGVVFPSRQALGGHRSQGVLLNCASEAAAPAADVTHPVIDEGTGDEEEGELATIDEGAGGVEEGNDQVLQRYSIAQLLQRPTKVFQKHVVVPLDIQAEGTCDTDNTYQLHETQTAYEEYVQLIRCSQNDEFWRVFAAVYRERAVIINRVLKASKNVFVHGKSRKKRFASSVRDLRAKSAQVAGHFPSMVMHETLIDLREFRLPGGLEEVKFRFVNPLWAWAAAANDMIDAGHKIIYLPKAMFHEVTGERLYGAGVAFGEKLRWAALQTPRGGKPALFGISFDGGDSGVSDRNLYPICVSVLNIDGADPLACTLVAYMPSLDVPKVFKLRKKRFLLARAHVVQRCIGAILDELEAVSRDGFAARIGGETIRLHPFLVAVRVDSKERKTYFGLKSDRSCAICRFRKGWSSLRRGTTHRKDHMQRNWNLAIDTPTTRRRNVLGRAQKRAREQLCRHGFHKKQRCTLLDHANSILVRDPNQQIQLLFAGLIFNDLLHWLLNCCDYAFDAIEGVMTKEMTLGVDENNRRLPMFRKSDGTGVRRFRVVCSNTYLTTARRITLSFVWIHALGTNAHMLPATCRRPALAALTHLQIIILACHGRRSYSVHEWSRLLIDSAMVLFDSLQFLMQYKEDHDTRENARAFTPMQRLVTIYV